MRLPLSSRKGSRSAAATSSIAPPTPAAVAAAAAASPSASADAPASSQPLPKTSPLQPSVPLAALTLHPVPRPTASAPQSVHTSTAPSPRLPASAHLVHTPASTTAPLTPASPVPQPQPQPPPPTPHLSHGPPFASRGGSTSSHTAATGGPHTVTETRRLQLKTHARTGRKMVNQYIILQELGRGVHGQVRLALDTNSLREDDENDSEPHGRLVAVKIVQRQPRKRLKIGGHSSKAVPRLDDFADGDQGGASSTAGEGSGRPSNLRFDERHAAQRGGRDGEFGNEDPSRNRNAFLTTDAKVKREIAILKKLHHTNVVSLLEVIDDPDSKKIFMVLEYMAGGELHWRDESPPLPGSLEERLNMPTPRPTLTIAQIQGVMRDLVCGLQYLHYQGIIHRDIKPANLLWDEGKKTVKISDFGVSHFSATLQRVAQQTQAGSTGGNSANASAASSPPVEHKSLFSEPFAANPHRSGSGDSYPTSGPQGFLTAVSDEQELAKTAGSPAFFAPELCVAGDPSNNSRSYLSLRHLSLSPSLGGPMMIPETNPLALPPGKRPPITKAIDIWAVGVTLYCLCFGYPPFDAESEYALFGIIPNEDYEVPSWAGAPDREQAAALGLLPETASEHAHGAESEEGRGNHSGRPVVEGGRKRSSSSGALLGGGRHSSSASTVLAKGKSRQAASSHPTPSEIDNSLTATTSIGGLIRPPIVVRPSSSYSDADEDARTACGRLRVGPRARRWGRRKVEEVASGWGSPWAARRWADEEADVHPDSRRPSFSGRPGLEGDGTGASGVVTTAASSSTGESGRATTTTNVSSGSTSSKPTSPERTGFKASESRAAVSPFARPMPPHWSASPSNDGSWLPDFPTHLLSEEAMQLLHLLDALLTKDPTKRITLDEVKIHPFLLGGFPVSPEAETRGEEDVAREQALAARDWLERTDVERHFEEVQVSGEEVERALTVGGVQHGSIGGGDKLVSETGSGHPDRQPPSAQDGTFTDHAAGTPGASDVWLALAPLAGVAGVTASDTKGHGEAGGAASIKSRSKGTWKIKLKEKLRKWGIRTPAPSQPGTCNASPLMTPVMTRVNSPVLMRQDPVTAITTAATAVASVAVAGAAAAVDSLHQTLMMPSESGRFDDAIESGDQALEAAHDGDPDPGADVVSLGGFPRTEPPQHATSEHVDLEGTDLRTPSEEPLDASTPGTTYDEEQDDDIDLHLDELSDDDIDEPAPERRSLPRTRGGGEPILRNDGSGWKYEHSEEAFGRPAEATIALSRRKDDDGSSGALTDLLKHAGVHGLAGSAADGLHSRSSYRTDADQGASLDHSHATLYSQSNGASHGQQSHHPRAHQPSPSHTHHRMSPAPSSQHFRRQQSVGSALSSTGPASRSGSEGLLAARQWAGAEHRGGEGEDEDDEDDDEDGCVSFEARKVVRPKLPPPPSASSVGSMQAQAQVGTGAAPTH